MAILTIRQKQSLLGYLVVVLLVVGALGLIGQFFVLLPWLAWPLLAALVGAAAWWYVRRVRAERAKLARAEDPDDVPVLAGDTVETLAFRILEANINAGKNIGPVELGIAKELAARGLQRFNGPKQ